MKYACIAAQRDSYPVALMCRVSRSPAPASTPGSSGRRVPGPRPMPGCGWRSAPSMRRSQRRYGRPRVHRELRAQGVRVGATRVGRLLRLEGLRAKRARRYVGHDPERLGRPARPTGWPVSLPFPRCRGAIGSGWRMRRPVGRRRAGSIWPSCWISPRGGWWAGRRGPRWTGAHHSALERALPCGSRRRGCSITPTKAPPTLGALIRPGSPSTGVGSATAAGATAGTTRWWRASSPR